MGFNDEINEIQKNWERKEEEMRVARERARLTRVEREEREARERKAAKISAKQRRRELASPPGPGTIGFLARQFAQWARENQLESDGLIWKVWKVDKVTKYFEAFEPDPDSRSMPRPARTEEVGHLYITRRGKFQVSGSYPSINPHSTHHRKVRDAILRRVLEEHQQRLRAGLPKPTPWPPS